ILGPLEVIEDGCPLVLGGARQRALLAILLTRVNEVVSTDRLIDGLWGEHPPRTALNTLQYFVSRLRKALGADRIVTRAPGYLARVAPGELDLERFERLVEAGGEDEAGARADPRKAHERRRARIGKRPAQRAPGGSGRPRRRCQGGGVYICRPRRRPGAA